MKHRNKQKNLFLHRSASVLISLMMALSVFMPNVLSVWAEEVAEDGEWTAEAEEAAPEEEPAEEQYYEEDPSADEEGSGSEEAPYYGESDESAGITEEEPADEIIPEETKPDAPEESAYPAFSQSVTVGDVVITVSAPEGVFPENASLQAEKVTVPEADQAVDEKRASDRNVAVSYTFDIKVLDAAGNELQPAEGQNVSVAFTLAEAADLNLDTDVYHITEEDGVLNAEELPLDEEGETVKAETPGFSLFTVEFTYQELSYVLKGTESVPLSDILFAVGLSGYPDTASVSNDSLFSVKQENGEWTLISHKAFDSKEWLKVTINGITYEITVTDEEGPMD